MIRAPPVGFEPTTVGLADQYTIQAVLWGQLMNGMVRAQGIEPWQSRRQLWI